MKLFGKISMTKFIAKKEADKSQILSKSPKKIIELSEEETEQLSHKFYKEGGNILQILNGVDEDLSAKVRDFLEDPNVIENLQQEQDVDKRFFIDDVEIIYTQVIPGIPKKSDCYKDVEKLINA